jgi:hypothetical protein
MSTSVRRRTAKIVLALALAGSAALAANTALLSPTADGGEPGPIITPGKPGLPRTVTTIDTRS